MADDDRANMLKSLGVGRRSRGDAPEGAPEAAPSPEATGDDAPSATADDAAEDDAGLEPVTSTESQMIPGLGIKRRKPADAGRPQRPAKDAPAVPADAAAPAAAADPAAAPAAPGAEPARPAVVTPLETRGCGTDQAAVLLAQLFRARPALRVEYDPVPKTVMGIKPYGKLSRAEGARPVPEAAFKTKRTHGFYQGDGRPDRKMVVGFRPGLVVFTLPTYPEPPVYVNHWKNKYDAEQVEVLDPGLNEQPRFVDDGFVVTEPYNRMGEGYVYVAFEETTPPLLEAPAPEDEEAVAAGASSGRIPGLGVRRRSKPTG